jgi:hypothetical protein
VKLPNGRVFQKILDEAQLLRKRPTKTNSDLRNVKMFSHANNARFCAILIEFHQR